MISIGNIAAGGRAKTPMAALAASLLRDAGERPAILSRGYGRRVAPDGVVVVRDPGGIRADLDRSGDEPLMLARALDGVAVLVSSSRFLAGRLAETWFGCTVHVLDDGFQHFDLHRDADLVVVARADLDRPVTLPSGRLREPLDALAAADAVVLLDAGSQDPAYNRTAAASLDAGSEDPAYKRTVAASLDAGSEDPAYKRTVAASLDAGSEDPAYNRAAADSDVGRVFRPGLVKPGRPVWHARRVLPRAATIEPVLACAGIAAPPAFFAALRANGWNVAAELPFRDHYRYSRADVDRIVARARAAGAARVVTTEKDYVRLLPFRPFAIAVEAVPLAIEIDDRASFAAWLLAACRGAGA